MRDAAKICQADFFVGLTTLHRLAHRALTKQKNVQGGGLDDAGVRRSRQARCLKSRNVSKRFGGTQALSDVGLRSARAKSSRCSAKTAPANRRSSKSSPASTRLDQRHDLLQRPGHDPCGAPHADLVHPSGSRPHRLDDGDREYLSDARLFAPLRPHRLGAGRASARARALAKLGADIDPDLRIQNLCAHREKSLVAIARALMTDAEILVLDEPTASLPADEVARLFARAAAPARARRRHDLCLAPARRGVRDRRPHGGAARRQGRRRARRRRDHA